MAENSNTPEKLNANKQVELKNHARSSSPSFDPRKNQTRQKNGTNQNTAVAAKKRILTEGIKKGAQAYGIPEGATEQLLNTDTGQAALDAAAGAPTISSGAKEAVKVIATRKIYPKILIGALAPFLIILLFTILIFGKDSFGGIGDGNDMYEELKEEIADIARTYKSKTTIDGNLILATLVAYNDMEDIENEDIDSKNMAYMKNQIKKLAKFQIMTTSYCDYDSSTMRQIASNDVFDEENYKCLSDPETITTYSREIEEGNFDDNNSGSIYYWNLIDEGFIFDYYNEYMINKEENNGENDEIITKIISEIYDYYNMMDKLVYSSSTSVCSKGITVDGVTMNFEDYIKGVLKSELGYSQTPLETLKALAVAARSVALHNTDYCTSEIVNSTVVQTYKEYSSSIDNPNIEFAVNETSGEYLTLDGDVFYGSYSTFPSLNSNCATTCDSNSCQTELFYNWNTSDSHTIEIPRDIGFPVSDVYDYATGLGGVSYGHCVGMSQIGAWYDADNGMTYEEILEKYYTDSVKITVASDEGLVEDENGFLKRTSMATRDNPYYYASSSNYSLGHIGIGSNEGECAWYALRRTNEIIGTMGLQGTYSYVQSGGNGNGFCYSSDYNQFEKSNNPNDPDLKPGALISWNSDEHKFGHVAVVEAVYRDADGNITSIDISEGGVGYGELSAAGLTSVEELWNIESVSTQMEARAKICSKNGCQNFRNISYSTISHNFICYIKITQ